MRIRKGINGAVKGYPMLNPYWIKKFSFAFDKITDEIADYYFGIIE